MKLIINHVKQHKELYTTILFVVLAFLQFGLLSFHHNIWYDEAYQMILNRYSLSDIIYYVSNDFSGPFFALGLKFITTIFGNELWVGRLFSLAIYSVSFLLAFYPIKRMFSYKTSVIFSILLLLIPINFFTAIEIRTYSVAFTATLGASVYALSLFQRGTKKDIALYILFSVIALYSHNYAIFYIFVLSNCLLIASMIKKRTILKQVFFSNCMILICFLPWIMTLVKQANNLDAKFWIEKPTFLVFPYTLSYLFGNYKNIYTLFFLMIGIGYIMTFILNKKHFYSALFCGIVLFLTILFVVLYSLYKSPLFYPKYLATFFGVFLLASAIVLGNYKQNYLVIILLIILCVPMLSRAKYEHSILEEENTNQLISYVSSVMKNKNKEIAFYHKEEFSLGVMEYFFPDSKHLIGTGTDIYVTVPDIFGDVRFLEDDEKINQNIDMIITCFANAEDRYYLKQNGFYPTDSKLFYIPYSNNYYPLALYERQ